ncbi:uncharacterized protein P174DRAFT_471072, partial [Aspergillus novofumigatus IBT 16806]
ITTVMPPGAANAGTINSMLFPPPVGITITTGLSPTGWRAWLGPRRPRTAWQAAPSCTAQWPPDPLLPTSASVPCG